MHTFISMWANENKKVRKTKKVIFIAGTQLEKVLGSASFLANWQFYVFYCCPMSFLSNFSSICIQNHSFIVFTTNRMFEAHKKKKTQFTSSFFHWLHFLRSRDIFRFAEDQMDNFVYIKWKVFPGREQSQHRQKKAQQQNWYWAMDVYEDIVIVENGMTDNTSQV